MNDAESQRLSLKIALNVINEFTEIDNITVYLIIPNDPNIKYSPTTYHNIEKYLNSNYEKNTNSWLSTIYDDPMFTPIQTDAFFDTFSSTAVGGATVGALGSVIGKHLYHREKRMNSLSDRNNRELERIIDNVGETFQQCLFRLIDEQHRNDVDVYKGARIDKKLFSKIKSNVNYKPRKHTVFAFAVSLKLSLEETKELLSSAGLAISRSSKFDIIMQYAIEQKIYDIDQIDYILFDFGLEQYIFNQC